jgi:hypothetical protein
VNPASQLGSCISLLTTLHLSAGSTLGNAPFKISGRPLLIDALIPTAQRLGATGTRVNKKKIKKNKVEGGFM